MHKRLLRVAFVLFAIGALYSGTPTYAADESLWRDGQDFTVSTIDGDQSAAYEPCRWTFASAVNIEGVAQQRYGCLASGSSLSLFTYLDDTVSNNQIFGVRIGSDGSFRRLKVHTPHGYRMRLLPGSDTLLVESTANPSATKPKLVLYRLADSPFIAEKAADGINVLNYQLDATKAIPLLGLDHDGTTEYRTVVNYVLSNNRRYMAVWLEYTFLVVVDLETLQSTAIDHLYGAWYGTYASPAAISDDGRYVYVDIKGYMYDTTDCGEKYDNDFLRKSPSQHFPKPCSRAYLSSLISDIDGITSKHHQYRFIDDDTALEFIHPYSGPNKVTTIATEAYDPTRLDYLALGDSYSSGEGDTETAENGTSYYLPLTDLDQNSCHISSRSYPFLLRDVWGISPDKMKSVACSGAQVLPDYFGPYENYYGQNNRILNEDDVDSIRKRAIDKFIPGHVRQIEFVKKYQPKVITLTAGGNDVGFGEILSYCAAPQVQMIPGTNVPYVASAYTCDYAVEGSFLNTMLYDSIDTQGVYTSRLIDDMVSASPDSKIVLIGYPSFVASDPFTICGLNSVTLDISELRMINKAVSYMNGTLRDLAEEKGVLFVDVEDSLVGGRLCEGSEYVTGFIGPAIMSGKLHDPNMFHPNAEGHAKIADSIRFADISSRDMPEAVLEPSGKSMPSIAMRAQLIDGDMVLTTNSSAGVEITTQTFADNTTVTTTTFSSRKHLGTHVVTGDGALKARLDFSSVEPGRHVLVAEGRSPSGEQLILYQFITVLASNTDSDGDGILDSEDQCAFIDSWYSEQSGADICASPITQAGSDNMVPIATTNAITKSGTPPIQSLYNIGAIGRNTLGTEYHQDNFAAGLENSLTDGVKSQDPSKRNANSFLFWPWLVFAGSIVVGGLIIYGKAHIKKQ